MRAKIRIDRDITLTALLCLLSSGLIGLVVHTLMWKDVDLTRVESMQSPLTPAPESLQNPPSPLDSPSTTPTEAPPRKPSRPKGIRPAFTLPA